MTPSGLCDACPKRSEGTPLSPEVSRLWRLVVAWRCPAETYVMLVWWAANPPTTRLSINVVVQFIGLIVLRRVGALTGTAGAGRQRKRRKSALRQAQGERNNRWDIPSPEPFVVSPSNHERPFVELRTDPSRPTGRSVLRPTLRVNGVRPLK